MVRNLSRGRILIALLLAGVLVAAAVLVPAWLNRGGGPVPSFLSQACGIPGPWLERTQRGYFEGRSGQISLLPRQPAYMASGAGGWSHSGPWPYLQRVPLVVYAPGIVRALGDVDRPVTTADVAPTYAAMLRGNIASDGSPLREVAALDENTLTSDPPKLIVTVVWDGGGWNTLEQWPDDWPELRRLMEEGVSYVDATVGSSPSVTPSVHTTLGTGVFPATHGITGVPQRDEEGEIVDSFLKGESSRFIEVETLAERWDEQNGNRSLVGMVGYEPWHLGMIGKGAEKPGGDKDDAAWLDVETNEWITNPDHYRLPPSLPETEGLEEDIAELDAADGEVDDMWRENVSLDDPERTEETPAFIAYHGRALIDLMRAEGYGQDNLTDLMFTNFKQIDRIGHYYNMASEEVHDSVIASDEQLGELVSFLDSDVGRGNYVLTVTADHGQQPDAAAVDGYGIDPNELEADINEEFGGDIALAAWPTELFVDEDVMSELAVSIEDVARFIGGYTLEDNSIRPDEDVLGAGRFEPGDRLFAMAIPSASLPSMSCRGAEASTTD